MLSRIFRTSVLITGLALAGCQGSNIAFEPPLGHPANPDSTVSAAAARPETLSLSDAVSSEAVRQVPDSHATHGAANATSNAEGPSATAAAPEAGALYSCPMHPQFTSADPNARCPECKMKMNKPVRAPAATAPAAAYACPMHPEVTSNDPEARCPKCKMKINKKVNPKAPAAPAPAGHDAHHEHGAGRAQ